MNASFYVVDVYLPWPLQQAALGQLFLVTSSILLILYSKSDKANFHLSTTYLRVRPRVWHFSLWKTGELSHRLGILILGLCAGYSDLVSLWL